jgi:hypothetical protein
MKPATVILASCALLLSGLVWGQQCRAEFAITLSVKTYVYPSDSADRYGHGKVEAVLRYKEGAPIPNRRLSLETTAGDFSCKLPDIANEVDSSSSDESCFTTDKNGRVLAYIINIPFNSQGMVTASCSFDDVSVKATGTFWIKRMPVIKAPTKKEKKSL